MSLLAPFLASHVTSVCITTEIVIKKKLASLGMELYH